MTIRSQFSAGLFLLILACGLVCSVAIADEIGGDTGYFEITSDPSGGAVYFDGSYKGTTPVTFSVLVTGSPSHTIRVTKSGYYDWQQSYQGNPSEGETISVNADLVFIPVTQPTTLVGAGKGYYSISSVPSGGSVYFDGSYKGITPVTVQVASEGTPGHTVSISLSGYETWSTSLSGNPSDGQTIPVNAYLTPVQNYGSISVTSSPSGATAVLDSGSSQVTPCTFTGVNAGTHTVYVSKSGYTSVSRTVTVSAGSTTQVSVTLNQVAPESGTIYVVSTPQGASAYVDGVYYGITPALATGLSPGNHQVRISLSGFQDWVGTVYVASGATTTVTQTLHVGTPTPTQAPGTGSVAVSSNPAGAQVFMDNVYEGITPLTISSVQPGTHSFLIKLTGYADWEVSEPVQSGQTTQIAATLSPVSTPTEGPMPATLVLVAVGLLGFVMILRKK
ncbi:MAG: PEGA domain-containing protein [Methanoregulaceae archaeon]|nr:PEGA domain-containing protein [Methanoregulaceae archaeon]